MVKEGGKGVCVFERKKGIYIYKDMKNNKKNPTSLAGTDKAQIWQPLDRLSVLSMREEWLVT